MAGSSDVAAIELDDDDATEPSAPESGGVSWRAAVSAGLAGWKDTGLGRTLLGLARWAVVAALVLAGYFGAAGINAGVEHLCRGSAAKTSPAQPPQLLATASAHD